MKFLFNNALIIIFILTISAIFYELLSVLIFRHNLYSENLGLSKKSFTSDLAKEHPKIFIKSQEHATLNRIASVSIDLVQTSVVIFISTIFLNTNLQKRGITVANSNITLIKSGFRELNRSEINFLSMVAGLFMLNSILTEVIKKGGPSFFCVIRNFFYFFSMYLIVVPIAVFILYILLKNFGRAFIFICYLALVIKLLPELLIQDDVNEEKFVNVDISKYPTKVQETLRKYNLENSVYEEKEKSSERNAALVGYGSKKRLEIYGNFDADKEESLNSVLMHEIGHARENTFFRKIIVYFCLIFVEMVFIVYLYEKISKKLSNETLSFFTTFFILFLVYRLILKQWLFAIYKMVSQKSEINCDMFAKSSSYGNSLGKTLFNISVESGDYIAPSLLYNFLRSTHPPIYHRINYLRN